jgi:heat shock protein HslJ
LTAAYSLQGPQIRFSGGAMTRMACVKGMETESQLVEALEKTRSWVIRDDTLEFLGEDGTVLAQFRVMQASDD